ncbi:MAG: hypothetical protein QXJ17_00575 [Nitrososphaeria archaeon]
MKTVPDDFQIIDEVKGTGLRNIGVKEVGLPVDELKRLISIAHDEGMDSFLEVYTATEDGQVRAVKIARK